MLSTFVQKTTIVLFDNPLTLHSQVNSISWVGNSSRNGIGSVITVISKVHDVVLRLNQPNKLLKIYRRSLRVQSQFVKDLLGQRLGHFHRNARPAKHLLQLHGALQLVAVGVQLAAQTDPYFVQVL